MQPVVESIIKTKLYGEWSLMIFNENHRVFIKNKHLCKDVVCVRVHSDCYTGDVLNSSLCDCGDQLNMALKIIHEKGAGVIIFPENHEGRGIGLVNKLKAYNLKDKYNTYEANRILGFPDDLREYDIVHQILDYLNIDKIELLSNDVNKISNLKKYIVKITPLITKYNPDNINYINVKNKLYGHIKMTSINYSIAIISTEWHSELLSLTKTNMMNQLNQHHVDCYIVPGAFEIPLMAKKISKKYDAIICLGLILKGDTAHFEYISSATINGLMTVQLETGVPIINGVLNCYTLEQAIERVDPMCQFSNDLTNTMVSVLKLR